MTKQEIEIMSLKFKQADNIISYIASVRDTGKPIRGTYKRHKKL